MKNDQKVKSVIEVQDCTVVDNVTKSDDSKSASFMCKKVTIEGIAGVLFGTLGTATAAIGLTPKNLESEIKEPEPKPMQEAEETVAESVAVEEAPVSAVNDDMTFSEAFAAARAEQGSDGTFTWHGGVYGTCYADEWDNKTEAEQNDIIEKVEEVIDVVPVEEADVTPDTQENEEQVDVVAEEDNTDDIEQQEVVDVVPEDNPATDEPVIDSPEPADDSTVTILGIDRDYDPEGNPVTAVVTEENGEIVSYFDENNDGQIDYKSVDRNENGLTDEDEKIDMSDQGVTVADFEHQLKVQEGIISESSVDEPTVEPNQEEQIADQMPNIQYDMYADGSEVAYNNPEGLDA